MLQAAFCSLVCVRLPPLPLQMHQEDLRFVRRCLEAFANQESYHWAMDNLAEVEKAVDAEDDADEDAVPQAILLHKGDTFLAGKHEADLADDAPMDLSLLDDQEGEQPLPSAAKSLVTCRTKITRDPACNAVVLPWWLPPERVPPEVTGALQQWLCIFEFVLHVKQCPTPPLTVSTSDALPDALTCLLLCCRSGVGHHRHRARHFVLPHSQARAGQVCHRPPSLGVCLPVCCPHDCGGATAHQVGGQDST